MLLRDRAPRVRTPEPARLGGELMPMDRMFVALQVGLEMEGTGADGAGVAADVLAVNMCAGYVSALTGSGE